MPEIGCFYGIGVGPGDPELITLKAARRIREAAVVAYVVSAKGRHRARDYAAALISSHAEEMPLPLPICVARSPAQNAYDSAARAIAARLKSGQDVVFLCEGDPLFYGSCSYLLVRLQPHFRTEIVPGVSSVMACAALMHSPLATREDVFITLPATLPVSVLETYLRRADSVAILKIGRHWKKICTLLVTLDLVKSAKYSAEVGRGAQFWSPLSQLWPPKSEASSSFSAPYFSTILIYKG